MTEKLLQRKRQSYVLYTRQHSHSSQWLIYRRHPYLHCSRASWRGLCSCGSQADHVNSKTRPPHLSPRHGGSTGEREGIKYHWSGSRSHSVPGRQDGGGGQKCRILLVKASRPLRSIDYIEHPWMPLLTSTFTFTKRAYYQLSDWVRHSSSSAEQKKATDI